MGKLCCHPDSRSEIELFLAVLCCAGKLRSLSVPGFLNLCGRVGWGWGVGITVPEGYSEDYMREREDTLPGPGM